MSALLINLMTVKDGAKIQEYAQRVGPLVGQYGGEVVTKGAVKSVAVGDISAGAAAVIRFPSIDAINHFLDDADYAPLIPIRDAGADVNFVLVDEA